MKSFLYWLCLIGLITIHTIDMELTTFEIGNQWQSESFPPMSICIKHFGIYNAVWISRIVMYSYFIISYKYRNRNYFLFIMVLFCFIYYAAMFDWLFYLNIINWPFKLSS